MPGEGREGRVRYAVYPVQHGAGYQRLRVFPRGEGGIRQHTYPIVGCAK